MRAESLSGEKRLRTDTKILQVFSYSYITRSESLLNSNPYYIASASQTLTQGLASETIYTSTVSNLVFLNHHTVRETSSLPKMYGSTTVLAEALAKACRQGYKDIMSLRKGNNDLFLLFLAHESQSSRCLMHCRSAVSKYDYP